MDYAKKLRTPEKFINKLNKFLFGKEHIILYGPENSGKYTQALHICEKFSKSKLKYSRKIEIELNNEKLYFNISDIHFEIDFELLGTNQINIWIEFINSVSSIIETQGHSILICKNCHFIKDDLLCIFHTFMRDPKLKLILCTKHISYLPLQLKEKCSIFTLQKIPNIISYSLQYTEKCNKIVDFILCQSIDLSLLRELIYNLFTYNFDIHECLIYIIFKLIKNEYIKTEDISNIFKKSIETLKYYNTNYRPIYHLELFLLDLHTLRQCNLTNNNVNDKSIIKPLIENI